MKIRRILSTSVAASLALLFSVRGGSAEAPDSEACGANKAPAVEPARVTNAATPPNASPGVDKIWTPVSQDGGSDAQEIAGELQVGKTQSVVLYFGEESGDYAAYCFANDSAAGRSILAACKDRERCEVTATIGEGECKVPGLEATLSASGRVLTVKSAKPAGRKTEAAPADSIYTALSAKQCKTVKVVEETGASVQQCTGVAGYNLLVEDDDARQSITVLAPGGKRHPLNYWQVVTTAFSTVGEKAEWRVARQGGKGQPVALIVRVYANENPEAPNQRTSYLAVAKITADEVCVTDKVRGGAGAAANEEARRAADSAAGKPCLE